MPARITRPHPSQPRPPETPRPGGDDLRKSRILRLKEKIRSGAYDADSKIDGLIDVVVKDSCTSRR